MTTTTHDTSCAIQQHLRPIIAQYGIKPVLVAIADRLAEDADAVSSRGPMGARISVELDCLGGAIREALDTYEL